MVGFFKYCWREFRGLVGCAEKFYEKVFICSYAFFFVCLLPLFVWVNLTESDMILRVISLAGTVITSVLWVFFIGLAIQDYAEVKDGG